MTNWYHGTTTAHGDLRGAQCDPRKAGFEPAIWATAAREQALTYARSAVAVHGGSAVVYKVEVSAAAEVRSGLDPQTRRQYVEIRDSGVDAIFFDQGEGGVPMIAILTKVAVFGVAV